MGKTIGKTSVRALSWPAWGVLTLRLFTVLISNDADRCIQMRDARMGCPGVYGDTNGMNRLVQQLWPLAVMNEHKCWVN